MQAEHHQNGTLHCAVCECVPQKPGVPCKLCGRTVSPERDAMTAEMATSAITRQILFGETAVRQWEDGIRDPRKLDGALLEYRFATEAECEAFLLGLAAGQEWNDYLDLTEDLEEEAALSANLKVEQDA